MKGLSKPRIKGAAEMFSTWMACGRGEGALRHSNSGTVSINGSLEFLPGYWLLWPSQGTWALAHFFPTASRCQADGTMLQFPHQEARDEVNKSAG